MSTGPRLQDEARSLFPAAAAMLRRDAAWFHELDAWTEYWDVYHPETRGRFYFGDDGSEPGLLRALLPRDGRPHAFTAWSRMALCSGPREDFVAAIAVPHVRQAIIEVDDLIDRLFGEFFGDGADPRVQREYLGAVFRFAIDALPAAPERDARISEEDPRKSTAGRHRLEGDLMWFAWALQIEAAQAIAAANSAATNGGHLRRMLQLAAIAVGCPADFAWRGHRRTRSEYQANAATTALLRERGLRWLTDFEAAAEEIHALYRIREWGDES